MAKDGNKVIGFVGYGANSDDTLTDCGEVFALYVLAEYHGKKVGFELMNAAFEKLTGYKKLLCGFLKATTRLSGFTKDTDLFSTVQIKRSYSVHQTQK